MVLKEQEKYGILNKLFEEDSDELRRLIHRLALELIGPCKYCAMVSSNPKTDTPISCKKVAYPSSSSFISIDTCLTCGEYKKSLV